jgi:2-dehydropantoate 2-reductase
VKTVQNGSEGGPYDVVLLTCKAYDLDSAIAAIAPAVGPNTTVVPLLNGMRHLDVLDARVRQGQGS